MFILSCVYSGCIVDEVLEFSLSGFTVGFCSASVDSKKNLFKKEAEIILVFFCYEKKFLIS